MPSPIGNTIMKTIVNSPLHALVGRNIAVITVIGCKTGNPIETPINVVRVGETLMVISMRKRTWWRNLRGGQISRLRLAGKLLAVRGEVIEPPSDVVNALKDYFIQYPGYAKYFNLKLGTDRSPDPLELERLAQERVIIKLNEI